MGTDDIRMYVVGIVLTHQSRWDIDGHHRGGRSVDVLHYGCKTAAQSLVQTAAEETVYHHMVCRQHGRYKLGGHFVEVHTRHVGQPLLVRLAVRRKRPFRIEEIHLEPVALPGQQSRQGKRIATVVPRSGKTVSGVSGSQRSAMARANAREARSIKSMEAIGSFSMVSASSCLMLVVGNIFIIGLS